MNITAEIQSVIDSEVAKKESILESKYSEYFDKLKHDLYETVKDYAKKEVSKVQLESLNKSCDTLYYKPLVNDIVNLLSNRGIHVSLMESTEQEESKSLLMEAVKQLQELRDMLAIHEMIESSLNGMNKSLIKNAIARFKNDERFRSMSKDDFLKEVADYVMKFNGEQSPLKPVQYESIDISKELNDVDNLLNESEEMPFNPKTKISIPSIKKQVLDEAYKIKNVPSNNTYSDDDPVKEFIDTWG